jgi:hypothetical protein
MRRNFRSGAGIFGTSPGIFGSGESALRRNRTCCSGLLQTLAPRPSNPLFLLFYFLAYKTLKAQATNQPVLAWPLLLCRYVQ